MLQPLVPRSPAARTLARVWRAEELYFKVPVKDADAAHELMVGVASHLAARAGVSVRILVDSEGRHVQVHQLLRTRIGPDQLASGGVVDCVFSESVPNCKPQPTRIPPYYNIQIWHRTGLIHVKTHTEAPWRHEMPLDIALAGAVE